MPGSPITSSLANVTLAYFMPKSGASKDKKIPVHFNPASLQYTVANTPDPNQKKDKKGKAVQYVSQSTAKLTMDLVFDTTLTGEDVRTITDTVAQLMQPDK